MLLAALVDLGFPLDRLRRVVRQLGFRGVRFKVQRIRRAGERVVRLSFSADRRIRFRTPREMRRWLTGSKLPSSIQRAVTRLIDRLVQAESEIHRVPKSQVHFHQLGRVDALAALTGFCAALEHLKIKAVYLSLVPVGGWYRGHNGRWRRGEGPVVGRLLRGVPVIQRPHRFEWTTPTAALLLTYGRPAGVVPPLRIRSMGRAVGHSSVPEGAGILRLLLAERA